MSIEDVMDSRLPVSKSSGVGCDHKTNTGLSPLWTHSSDSPTSRRGSPSLLIMAATLNFESEVGVHHVKFVSDSEPKVINIADCRTYTLGNRPRRRKVDQHAPVAPIVSLPSRPPQAHVMSLKRAVSDTNSSPPAPKKRGRPRKSESFVKADYTCPSIATNLKPMECNVELNRISSPKARLLFSEFQACTADQILESDKPSAVDSENGVVSSLEMSESEEDLSVDVCEKEEPGNEVTNTVDAKESTTNFENQNGVLSADMNHVVETVCKSIAPKEHVPENADATAKEVPGEAGDEEIDSYVVKDDHSPNLSTQPFQKACSKNEKLGDIVNRSGMGCSEDVPKQQFEKVCSEEELCDVKKDLKASHSTNALNELSEDTSCEEKAGDLINNSSFSKSDDVVTRQSLENDCSKEEVGVVVNDSEISHSLDVSKQTFEREFSEELGNVVGDLEARRSTPVVAQPIHMDENHSLPIGAVKKETMSNPGVVGSIESSPAVSIAATALGEPRSLECPEQPKNLGKAAPVTEVCPCDTTTGSTEDDLANDRSQDSENATPEAITSKNERQSNKVSVGPSVPSVPSSFRSRYGRREWGKQLTKIRLKLQEKRKLIRHRAIQARLRRRKEEAHVNGRSNLIPEQITFSHQSAFSATESVTPLTIDVNSYPVEKDKSLEAKPELVQINAENKKSMSLEQIIILNSDDDDESEDPWPFPCSPPSDMGEITNKKETIQSECSSAEKPEEETIQIEAVVEKPSLAAVSPNQPVNLSNVSANEAVLQKCDLGTETVKSPETTPHAKMHTRSLEQDKKDMVANSKWKDLFNSHGEPLDFGEKQSVDETKALHIIPKIAQGTKAVECLNGFVNTPCGDSYVTDQTLTSPPSPDSIGLCSCKAAGVTSPNKDMFKFMFCQAVDTVNDRIANCVSKVLDKMEFRASPRLPKMVLCKAHRKKLTRHICCPICGLFCVAGEVVDCSPGKGHYHHLSCQVKQQDGSYMCPHCGDVSKQHLTTLQLKRKPEGFKGKPQFQTSTVKPVETTGLARMCIRMVSKPTSNLDSLKSETGGSGEPSFESKLFEVSKSKNLDGAEKSKLINVLSGLQHLTPLMKEKMEATTCAVGMADLSGYIEKNDISQLVLGICEMVRRCEPEEGKCFILDRQLDELSGQTLLHLAVQHNQLAVVHCLVMAGASVSCVDSKGCTPLMQAARTDCKDILKYLIGAGAHVASKDLDGMTALHMAAVSGHKGICEYLVSDLKSNINCKDEGGWTPLVWAIENNHSHVVKFLVNAGSDIHTRDNEGNAAIHWAAFSGNTDIIKLLLTKSADIEAVNELGDRPLHIAVRQARTDAVILLLSQGADTSSINNVHQTPAECCHGACSENMKAFLNVNDVLRSVKLNGIQTRAPRLLHQDITRGKERLPVPVTNDVDNTNYPTDFTYVTESIWTSPVPVNYMITSLSRCNCAGDCSRNSCSCARSSIACWYKPGGVLAPEFDFTSPAHIYECNRACGCWMNCSNRLIQHGITVQLELFRTKNRGWGVRAKHEIVKGSFVCEYVGELITDSTADEREDDSYLFDLDNKEGDTYCMDAKSYGNISRFINHRCEPNLTPVSVFVDHQDIRFPRICLFANKNIPTGEELGFDYGERFWLVKYKHFLCECGAESCKYNEKTIKSTLSLHNVLLT